MPTQLNPYLTFDGDAREAMDFYAEVFGGTVTSNTFGEFGDPEAPGADGIMHASLETDGGVTLMGADPAPGQSVDRGNDVSMSLSGDDEDELRGYWEALSDGGQVTMDLEPQTWGDTFGMCVDRFGVSWMVNIAGERA